MSASDNVSSKEELEQFALQELERFCLRLNEEGAAPHQTHLLVQRDPDSGEELPKPRFHQIVYDSEMTSNQISTAENHMASSLKALGAVHLWHDLDSHQVVLIVHHEGGVIAAAKPVTRTKTGYEFGEVTDLFPQDSPDEGEGDHARPVSDAHADSHHLNESTEDGA